ncbi:MAG: hypothetical protein A3G92_04960 [Deltaproteobacteria bacterium RIFCSPLOWO2_12_FULL_38_8]|nr:MAG: hypothetical protein A3A72_06740 [Deltaproteobacteria bacterium RIFCSPLOWO2_01_FULL_38_9]OGQ60769.1 MAG: hypothetical protein A3G92_04960 [Deltaproteobacteria bacterium RIFCSPLOWO2_12_FULL_38_8]
MDVGHVVLVHPLEYTKNTFTEEAKQSIPISIWYLGSYLTHYGAKVTLINFESDKNAINHLREIAPTADLIGLTMMTSQITHSLTVAKIIKEEIGDIPIVAGGVHPTLYPKETIETPYVDFGIYGEGEIALFELLHAIKEKKPEYYSTISRLSYKKNGEIFYNSDRTPVDHSNYPDLNYSILDQKVLKAQESLPLITSRGCPYNCQFCCNVVIAEKQTFSSWTTEKIMYEMRRGIELGVTDFFIWDDNFFQKKSKTDEFLKGIKKLPKKITWFGNCRAEYFHQNYLSREFLKDLRSYGLTRVSIGAESGSEKMLTYLQKGNKPEHFMRSAEWCAEADIAPSYSFMIGMPKEEDPDIHETIKIIYKLCEILPLPKILGPMLYLPLPGSGMFNDCVNAGWQPPKTIQDWADMNSGYGFHAYNRPWIKNPKMVRIIWFYSLLICAPFGKIVKLIRTYSRLTKHPKHKEWLLVFLALGGAILGKLRYKLNFYAFPVETKIFASLRSINSM